MKKTKNLVAAVVCGSAISLSGADLELQSRPKLGIETKSGLGAVRIAGKPSQSEGFTQDAVQVYAEVKAPVRQVEGLKVGLKAQDDSELNKETDFNGVHKLTFSPSLEMKVNEVSVTAGTDVVRKMALTSNKEETERLYTDYLRPKLAVNYKVNSQVSVGMGYAAAIQKDQDNAFQSGVKTDIHPIVNEDNELEMKANYQDSLVGLGVTMGYNFGKLTKAEEAAQSFSTRFSANVKASDRVGLVGDFGVGTNHEQLEAKVDSLGNLLYSGSLGMDFKATQDIKVGALAKTSYQKNSAGFVYTKQTLGLTTSVAI